ncbi:MAG: hypothetical protein ACJ78Q_08525 [Chloroflexia bacterium]
MKQRDISLRAGKPYRAQWHLAIGLMLTAIPLMALAACDIGPAPSGQRGVPTATVLGRIVEDDSAPEPTLPRGATGTVRPRRTSTPIPTITSTNTSTPTITPGTPLPTNTRTYTLTPFATPTRYSTATPVVGPPTVTRPPVPPTETATATATATETQVLEEPPTPTPAEQPTEPPAPPTDTPVPSP